MIARPIAAALLVSGLLVSGCATGDAAPWVELKGKRFTVEVADDDAERARGLMFRDALAADAGMLFVHDAEQPQAYWMKNTKIPLDILYFDARRKLVSVQKRVPPCSAGDRCPPYPSEGSALYVLELNAGTADTLGVAAGDELRVAPGVIAAPAK
jgi:uncharacterized membrane protein (UPF0127 family)